MKTTVQHFEEKEPRQFDSQEEFIAFAQGCFSENEDDDPDCLIKMPINYRGCFYYIAEYCGNFTDMRIYLTDEEVIELAYDVLDLNQPNPDKVHEIAKLMDMRYDENLGMYEDIERLSFRMMQHKLAVNTPEEDDDTNW